MAYRYNGVECDTYEELQRLMGAARTTSAVVKETRKEEPTPKATHTYDPNDGGCENPEHRDDCRGRKSTCHRRFS